MSSDTLTITDNRNGKSYEIPIQDGTIRAMDLRQIKISDDDFGLMSYDPAFTNTASCRSEITFIDGEKGILRYRGYPIEELAEKTTFLEVAYLLPPDCIGSGTQLVPPLGIEPGTTIGSHCTIGPDVYIESNCAIGAHVLLQDAVIFRDTRIEDGREIVGQVLAPKSRKL